MERALTLADQAEAADEVPVGAVLVRQGEVLGEGFNAPIGRHDPTAHAEIRAIRAASKTVGNYRLPDTDLYLTLEPCAMCAGAIIHARIQRVFIAAREPRAGAAGSLLNILDHPQLNHRCEVYFGLLEQQSAKRLKSFFKRRRNA